MLLSVTGAGGGGAAIRILCIIPRCAPRHNYAAQPAHQLRSTFSASIAVPGMVIRRGGEGGVEAKPAPPKGSRRYASGAVFLEPLFPPPVHQKHGGLGRRQDRPGVHVGDRHEPDALLATEPLEAPLGFPS